jgi:hypothetical protein
MALNVTTMSPFFCEVFLTIDSGKINFQEKRTIFGEKRINFSINGTNKKTLSISDQFSRHGNCL